MKLQVTDMEDLARGAAFLGTGGGGDPYIGRLLAQAAIGEFGMPEVVEPEDVPDDATVFTAAMLGAPTVLIEKAANGEDIDLALKRLSQRTGKTPDYIMPIEIGGLNSMIPILAAARAGLPLINADGMGRAFPEIQMVTFNVYGIEPCPAAIVDEHLNSAIIEANGAKQAEDLVRAVAIQMGLSTLVSVYPMTGKDVKAYGVHRTLTLALEIGRAIRTGRESGDPVASLLSYLRTTEYYNKCAVLFDGKITDIRRETTRGFAIGHCDVEALDGSGETMNILFQNEFLIAKKGDKTMTLVPDLICVVDRETAEPITTEGLKYGQRIKVIGVSAAAIMRTPESLDVFGPQAFGIDEPFTTIEDLNNL
ncbi:hypothetical protein GCM10017044_04590 [Kordiimonas sediminis]|uniref:DUF917 domain-containing protein n=1 Tax=Kordiimonas sediminis TaxID=1735581 RepID=A0A919ALK9_9PROT|nr:DUF917 domain-containing protein [Kordiimonas sediminis]GHF13596.1 hypothetical protein GCM10017044_04590 [Kordiimonas sediminis]